MLGWRGWDFLNEQGAVIACKPGDGRHLRAAVGPAALPKQMSGQLVPGTQRFLTSGSFERALIRKVAPADYSTWSPLSLKIDGIQLNTSHPTNIEHLLHTRYRASFLG